MSDTTIMILKSLGSFGYLILEFFLGKTDHGSTIGFVLNFILKILKGLGINLPGKGENS